MPATTPSRSGSAGTPARGAVLATALGMGADTRHDGVISVRRACTLGELTELLAPLPGRVSRRFPTGLALLPV